MIISTSWASGGLGGDDGALRARPSRSTVTRSVTSRTSSRSWDTNSTLASGRRRSSRTIANSRSMPSRGQEHGRLVEHEQAALVAAPRWLADALDRADDREQRALGLGADDRRRVPGSIGTS